MPAGEKVSGIEQGVRGARSSALRFLELLGAMKRYVREELAPPPERGMSEEKFRSLLGLKALGSGSLKNLAAHDGLSASAQCIMLDRLVAEGFALRSPDPEDRRRVRYELSEEGRSVLRSEIERRSAILTTQLARFSGAERERFAAAVEVLLAALSRMEE